MNNCYQDIGSVKNTTGRLERLELRNEPNLANLRPEIGEDPDTPFNALLTSNPGPSSIASLGAAQTTLSVTGFTASASEASRQSRSPGGMLDDVFLSKMQDGQNHFDESVITLIAQLLEASGSTALTRSPRLYIVLRTIEKLDLIDDLLAQNITDYWLPFEKRGLPRCLSPPSQEAFVQAQNSVLTTASNDTDLQNCPHAHFSTSQHLPFESIRVLGHGRFGLVDEVCNILNKKWEFSIVLANNVLLLTHLQELRKEAPGSTKHRIKTSP